MTDQPRIMLLGCAQSAGVAIDDLLASGRTLPAGVESACLPCGSAVDELHILRAFESGVQQVMVLTCFQGACRSADGPRWAERRVAALRKTLEEVGIPGWRVAFRNIAPNMGADLLTWVAGFHEPETVAQAVPETAGTKTSA